MTDGENLVVRTVTARWLTPKELAARADLLDVVLGDCRICPRACGVDRILDDRGYCRSGRLPIVSAYGPHFGEEPPISGSRGAGNIFFGNCNLRCVHCQNYQISQSPEAERQREVDSQALASVMLELAGLGCHNINLVSPTHFVPQSVRSLAVARAAGLNLPIIYNSNGYESLETLRLLDGVVQVYLPDLKYADEDAAASYSEAKDYVVSARAALREMYRQMGSELVFADDETLIRGLVIRLLVLPNGLADTEQSLQFIHDELSPNVAVSLMSQYYPTHRVLESDRYILLARNITAAEWHRALAAMERLGMESGWSQDWAEAPHCYRPDFSDRFRPFKTER
jgi:putative pyruvate formate lyase activating enzyme